METYRPNMSSAFRLLFTALLITISKIVRRTLVVRVPHFTAVSRYHKLCTTDNPENGHNKQKKILISEKLVEGCFGIFKIYKTQTKQKYPKPKTNKKKSPLFLLQHFKSYLRALIFLFLDWGLVFLLFEHACRYQEITYHDISISWSIERHHENTLQQPDRIISVLYNCRNKSL